MTLDCSGVATLITGRCSLAQLGPSPMRAEVREPVQHCLQVLCVCLFVCLFVFKSQSDTFRVLQVGVQRIAADPCPVQIALHGSARV